MGLCVDEEFFQVGGDPFFSVAVMCKELGVDIDIRDALIVYVVGRIEPLPLGTVTPCPYCLRPIINKYHIQGVAAATGESTAEEVAVSMCRDDTYFIGPLVVNTCLSHEVVHWPGAYFPMRRVYDPYDPDEEYASPGPELDDVFA